MGSGGDRAPPPPHPPAPRQPFQQQEQLQPHQQLVSSFRMKPKSKPVGGEHFCNAVRFTHIYTFYPSLPMLMEAEIFENVYFAGPDVSLYVCCLIDINKI